MESYIINRQKELEKYPKDEPILIYLRQLKKDNLEAYLQILFFFGEMHDIDISHRHSVSWIVEKKYLNIIKKSFKIISQKCRFEIKDCGFNMKSIRVYWNEIDPIVFNKIIFPDFSIIPKENLVF
jgi:hypothetical protein